MALVFPNCTALLPVRTQLVATTSYVAGTVISAGPEGEHNALGILVNYVKGDETSIEIKVESTSDPTSTASGSVTWYQQVTQSASGGTVTLVPAIYTMTAASAAATQPWTIIINPVKGQMYRISVKATGGTPTGTIGVKAVLGWV